MELIGWRCAEHVPDKRCGRRPWRLSSVRWRDPRGSIEAARTAAGDGCSGPAPWPGLDPRLVRRDQSAPGADSEMPSRRWGPQAYCGTDSSPFAFCPQHSAEPSMWMPHAKTEPTLRLRKVPAGATA